MSKVALIVIQHKTYILIHTYMQRHALSGKTSYYKYACPG